MKLQKLLIALSLFAMILSACGSVAGNEPAPTLNPDGVPLTADDQTELIRLTLERALVQQEISDYALLADQGQPFVLSTENIDPALVPEMAEVDLTLLTPEEIQAQANEEGDFLYLHFDEMTAQSADAVTVSLSNTWAVAEDSETGYLSGGGFTIEYTRENGGWTGEVTVQWIS